MTYNTHIVIRLSHPMQDAPEIDGYSDAFVQHQLMVSAAERFHRIPITIQEALRNYLVHGRECEVISVLHQREPEEPRAWGTEHYNRNMAACAGLFKESRYARDED